MARYVALLDGVEGAYGIVVPDLPGCTAAGETIAETVADAIEAVREWILDAREDGEAIPEPRDMAALKTNGRLAESLRDGAAFIVIPVLIDSGRPAKANLSLDFFAHAKSLHWAETNKIESSPGFAGVAVTV